MALTYPAAFLFENAASSEAGAIITASASLPKCPPSKLQTPHVGQKWRVESDTAHLTFALAGVTSLDSIGLFGIKAIDANLVDVTSSIVSQVRVSLSDTSAVDGALYNSGSAAGRIHSYYRNLVALIDGAVNGRYGRIDLSCAGAAFIEAGLLMVGARDQVAINMAYGASDTPVDLSVVTESERSGADWIDERPTKREWNFTFEALKETERFGWVEDMDRLIGQRNNVMCVRRVDSSNLGRDTLCGRIAAAAPVVSVQGFINGGNVYSKAYTIRQRL